MNEHRLNEVARRLGARAAERLDVAETARRVVTRLRDEPAQPAGVVWIHQTWIRIAATVVVLIGGGVALGVVPPGHGPGGGGSTHAAHLVADDLNDLSTDELQDMLSSFDEIVTDSVAVPESSDLRELDARDLRAVLRDLEG